MDYHRQVLDPVHQLEQRVRLLPLGMEPDVDLAPHALAQGHLGSLEALVSAVLFEQVLKLDESVIISINHHEIHLPYSG